MEVDLRSLLIGSFVGAFIASATMLVLFAYHDSRFVDYKIAELILKEARAECVGKDRPFRIEGAGAYISAGCGRH